MSKVSTINDNWKAFEKAILDPIRASAIQRKEMKRAFFSGASAAHSIIFEMSSLPEDQIEKEMRSLDQQIKGFALAVQMGEA